MSEALLAGWAADPNLDRSSTESGRSTVWMLLNQTPPRPPADLEPEIFNVHFHQNVAILILGLGILDRLVDYSAQRPVVGDRSAGATQESQLPVR